MMTTPNVEEPAEQHYVGIRTQATMQELPTVIPKPRSSGSQVNLPYVWLFDSGSS